MSFVHLGVLVGDPVGSLIRTGSDRGAPARPRVAQLSPSSRILCGADQLDALSADRPYRGKMPTERVVEIMRGERGTGLWPDAVDAAERILN